ncbi:hypothetical protein [Thermotoga caldifontis]|uniref:hypothetical protein n=1 Tax=Thermotoga caldifontis TaxID=1508419 RepID=UPI000596E467|nr:hypothetical protein [Thermotoga caldifontis]
MREQEGEEKKLQNQEFDTDISPEWQKKFPIRGLLIVILILLCSGSLVTSLLTVFLLNQFLSNAQIFFKPSAHSSIIPRLIEEAETRLSEKDYETAHLMILNALIHSLNNSELFEEYERILNLVTSNVESPQTVLWILNTGETLIIKAMFEKDPVHFSSIYQILKFIRDKRSEYLENLVGYIWKLEKGGEIERVNLLTRSCMDIFASSKKLAESLIDLFVKRLEHLSESEDPLLGQAYDTLEIALSLEEKLASSMIEITSIKEKVSRINELVGYIEKRELEREKASLLASPDIWKYKDESEEVLSAKVQTFVTKVQVLLNNPLMDDSEKEKIYQTMYKIQKDYQTILEEKKAKSLKYYNQWALEILKKYNPNWKTSQIVEYGRELGKIDRKYLFTEVDMYYNYLLSKIIEKLKEKEDITKFVDNMFQQHKHSP